MKNFRGVIRCDDGGQVGRRERDFRGIITWDDGGERERDGSTEDYFFVCVHVCICIQY